MSPKNSMIVLVSGEGNTDMGEADWGTTGICAPGKWYPGPMAHFVDRFISKLYGCEPLAWHSMWFVPESVVSNISKKISPMALRKSGTRSGAAGFKKNAFALLALAYQLSSVENCSVLPILFRDIDGSQREHREDPDRWRTIHDEIAYCVNSAEQIIYVCPMVPKPKSEVWLLCALTKNYHFCDELEELSGNDDSPKSIKSMLAQCIKKDVTRTNLVDLIEKGDIDPLKINMPSIKNFEKDLRTITYSMDKIKLLPFSLLDKLNKYSLDVDINK